MNCCPPDGCRRASASNAISPSPYHERGRRYGFGVGPGAGFGVGAGFEVGVAVVMLPPYHEKRAPTRVEAATMTAHPVQLDLFDPLPILSAPTTMGK